MIKRGVEAEEEAQREEGMTTKWGERTGHGKNRIWAGERTRQTLSSGTSLEKMRNRNRKGSPAYSPKLL